MSNYPPSDGQPNNPLPYPDRHRPAQPQQGQQPQYSQSGQTSGPTTAPGAGGLPYPDRPAKYSDYVQQSSSQQPYRQDSAPYQPPLQQDAPKTKPVVAEPQDSTGRWPTPPTAFNAETEAPPRPPKVGLFPENVGGSQAAYGSTDPYAMGNVAAALPNTSPPPPVSGGPYPSQYQSSAYGQSPGAAPPANPVTQIIPPYLIPQNQTTSPPSASPLYQAQSGSTGVSPIVTGAAIGAGTALSYSNPQSPITSPASPFSQQPSYTQTTSPPPMAPPYQQTQPYTAPPINAPSSQFGAPPPVASPTSQTDQLQSPPQQLSSPPQQTGYVSGPPPIPGVTPTSSFQPPPQTPRPQSMTAVGVPPHAGPIYSAGSVFIDGKEHPIPAFTHTIQTPSQCDRVLKEVYFGPYLRFTNTDLQRNLWLGSILLILPSNLPPPRLEFHKSGDFSHLQSIVPHCIYQYANWSFFRYDLVMPIFPQEQKWTYAITTQGTQIWEFTIPGQQQQWKFIAWSCNDFSASVKQEERDKLGFGTLWKDVMDRYVKEGAFHAQLGGGDQIYADRMWKEVPYVLFSVCLIPDF